MSVGLELKLEAFGFQAAEQALRKLLLKSGTLKSPLDAAGRLLVTRTREHFEAERSPEGEPWKALSPAYVARPRARGGRGGEAHPILFLRGYLEASLNYRAGELDLAVGSNRKFPGGMKSAAAIHQLGGVAGRGARIPARPFLGLDQPDADRVGELLLDYLGKL